MDEIFGKSGLLSRSLGTYEYRPEQNHMAQEVFRALSQERFLIVEAGTGTGKTLAYLVPAVLSGKRVVISTGTKTLQEQLFFKDIPFVQKHLKIPFRAAFMKGRGNYLCRRRYKLFTRQPLLQNLDEVAHYQALRKWAARTKTGDRSELAELPEDLLVWKEVSASSDTCLGQACEFFENCFITLMRQAAAAAEVVVVNHHLFFADLAVRIRGYGEVLPRYEAVIFDEAHQMEEVATQYLGTSVSNFRFEELVRDIHRESSEAKLKDALLNRIAGEILDGQDRFFSLLRSPEPRFRLGKEMAEKTREKAGQLNANLTLIATHIQGMKDPGEGIRSIGRRSEELRDQFQEVLALSDPTRVYWCENRGRGLFLHISPIDLSGDLQEHLYPRMKGAVFTSATLSTAGNFRFFKERLGLGGDGEGLLDERILDSSFDMKTQALLYLPPHLPDPNQPGFLPQAAEEMVRILKLTGGRAFLLFTSIRNMEEAYRLIKDRIPFTCYLQGERPKTALIQDFKNDIHSVLFATASFWEGVDIQGEALSCVIIDRLPFSRPNEPIMEARLEGIAASGGSPFWDYQVPAAILLLKQGLGRLIRTRQDRGLLVILDPRLTTKGYGKIFLESLPPCPVLREPGAISGFFQSGSWL